jgi:hypothetical protein
MLTPQMLREHAKYPDPVPPFWQGQAKQLLNWAADVLEAAQRVIDERDADPTTSSHD